MSSDGVERLSWAEFQAFFFPQWKQGEHVGIIGPTGRGKTTLTQAILPRRGHTVVLATKPRDKSLDAFKKQGFERIEKWPPKDEQTKVLLWPKFRELSDVVRQQEVFADALRKIFVAGHWCISADELRYICHNLRLSKHMEILWLQGRALNISIVGATQRPAYVPLELYSQSTHLFFYGDRDSENLKRISGIGGLDPKQIREAVATLPLHDVLYVNATTDTILKTRVERLK